MDKKKFNEMIKALDGLHASFDHLRSVTASGPASYYFERMKEYYDGCMKAAKFKVGGRVQLKDDIDTSNAPGWEHCKHFLNKGSKATIVAVDYHKGRYVYDIEFDNETYLAEYDDITLKKFRKPKYLPVTQKHTFGFSEKHLEKVK